MTKLLEKNISKSYRYFGKINIFCFSYTVKILGKYI